MVDRRGPSDGYDFGPKRQYRRAIYSQIRRSFSGHLSDKVCAMLPSIEGHEIDAALRAGFRERNICIIDDNPAIVATLKRKYPRVRSYGVSAERAARRIKEDVGSIDFLNLDLCGPIGDPLWRTLRAWIDADVFNPRRSSYMAVSVLRGRERGEYKEPTRVGIAVCDGANDAVVRNERDYVRLSKISAELSGIGHENVGRLVDPRKVLSGRYEAYLVRNDVYDSCAGNQTMMWGIWKLHRRPCLCDECYATFIQTFTKCDAKDPETSLFWLHLNADVHGDEAVGEAIRYQSDIIKSKSYWRVPTVKRSGTMVVS